MEKISLGSSLEMLELIISGELNLLEYFNLKGIPVGHHVAW
jgi:hypothetical protein